MMSISIINIPDLTQHKEDTKQHLKQQLWSIQDRFYSHVSV
jgi:hypothetical protein